MRDFAVRLTFYVVSYKIKENNRDHLGHNNGFSLLFSIWCGNSVNQKRRDNESEQFTERLY